MTASREQGLSILAYSPLAQGLLAGRFSEPEDRPTSFRARLRFFEGAHIPLVRNTLAELVALANEYKTTTVDIALQWLVRHQQVVSAICGASNPTQVREQACCLERPLPEELLASVDTLGECLRQRFLNVPSMWTGDVPNP